MDNTKGPNTDDPFKEEIKSLDDRAIIKRILAGERDLYALIVRKYNQRLYRVGMSIINNQSEVEDVMQACYIQAYEHLPKFEFRSAFSSWLTKIMVNECLKYLKKKVRSAEKKDSEFLLQSYRDAGMETPLTKVLNTELKSILETAIRQLPEKYRTVFIMREMEKMSVADTMECLGLSGANVKVRLNRAKVMLRSMLRRYLNDEEILRLYESRCDNMVEVVMAKIYQQ